MEKISNITIKFAGNNPQAADPAMLESEFTKTFANYQNQEVLESATLERADGTRSELTAYVFNPLLSKEELLKFAWLAALTDRRVLASYMGEEDLVYIMEKFIKSGNTPQAQPQQPQANPLQQAVTQTPPIVTKTAQPQAPTPQPQPIIQPKPKNGPGLFGRFKENIKGNP